MQVLWKRWFGTRFLRRVPGNIASSISVIRGGALGRVAS